MGVKTTGIAVVFLILMLSVSAQEKQTVLLRETLRGRVVAEVATLHYGSSLDHNWMSFFFAAEDSNGKVTPIQIAYAFYKSSQLPPNSFWDYSKVYKIKVERDHICDTTVESLAYVKNKTTNGEELPPSFVLLYAKGAPRDLLKREAVLPCYILWYGDYSQIRRTAK